MQNIGGFESGRRVDLGNRRRTRRNGELGETTTSGRKHRNVSTIPDTGRHDGRWELANLRGAGLTKCRWNSCVTSDTAEITGQDLRKSGRICGDPGHSGTPKTPDISETPRFLRPHESTGTGGIPKPFKVTSHGSHGV
ncbi:hypothetical protein WN51_01385 [Melipona quadrifasciata]|uniref:Uncharacterized protein n=1 Tax=Melipona quadrifasciata TaxID=166423 RepID=A0A0M8ZXM8_9HYME|nr:hypothetical protein WN51_01385 [Melipona quadrifasciata]